MSGAFSPVRSAASGGPSRRIDTVSERYDLVDVHFEPRRPHERQASGISRHGHPLLFGTRRRLADGEYPRYLLASGCARVPDLGAPFGGPLADEPVRAWPQIAVDGCPIQGEDCLGSLMSDVDYEAEELGYPRHAGQW
jgi:hypothetical protein